jgi:hypothetical protein
LAHVCGHSSNCERGDRELGHADIKTTSVYAHARPGESSGRYLKTR